MSMKAAVWRGPGQLGVEQVDVPAVVPGSILMRVRTCSVCGSDLRIYGDGNPRVAPPRVLGHEIAGDVVEVGKGVSTFSVGDRISLGADVPCGECDHCKSGRANCCDTNLAIGYQFDGGFAEYIRLDPVVVALGPVQKIESDLSYDVAALAEPLACCLNGYERVFIQPGASVVIFGAGPIGIMLALVAQEHRARQVVIVEPSAQRRARAQQLTTATVIDPSTSEPVEAVMDLTQGAGANAIFTACPVPETHEQAVRMVAKRGVVNFFGGLPKTSRPIQLLSNHIHYREAYVTGSHGSTPEQHRQALSLLERRRIDLSRLITHALPLDDVLAAFALVRSGEALKVAVHPNAG
jgi:L-iditol 2-dehydrogenase